MGKHNGVEDYHLQTIGKSGTNEKVQTSPGTATLEPRMVMEGLSWPLLLKRAEFSILAKGLLGFGSSGVPSTLAQAPTLLLHPMTL